MSVDDWNGARYKTYPDPADVPLDEQAASEGMATAMQRLIGDLVDAEVREHLAQQHDCTGNCQSSTVTRFVLEEIPEDQARFMLLETIKMLGVTYIVSQINKMEATDGPE